MDMTSCVYRCELSHVRATNPPRQFKYGMYYLLLDLDEIDLLSTKLRGVFGQSRWNPLRWVDGDFFPGSAATLAGRVRDYVRRQGVVEERLRIRLLTTVRTFGYAFNPISIYFCFSESGEPLCAVAEITNTYLERKPFFIPASAQSFRSAEPKHFYISPFLDHDLEMRFRLTPPGEDLDIQITTGRRNAVHLAARLTGKRRDLTRSSLLALNLRFPLVTLRTIGLIHWQAFRMWFKGVPYHRKTEHPELQREFVAAGALHE